VVFVFFCGNGFLFFQPSFGYICLQQPSAAFIGEAPERGFGGVWRGLAAWLAQSRRDRSAERRNQKDLQQKRRKRRGDRIMAGQNHILVDARQKKDLV
jgi:hypothetical protein